MSFTNPEILYALPAVLIPLIIHLFNFRRYKKQYFSNVDLLKEISIETKKQNQIKHFIVMLLRMLTIASLIFAFAGPQFANKDEKALNVRNITGIYIDNSFSMEAGDLNGRVFDKVVNMARQIVKDSPKEALFVVQNNNDNLLRIQNKDEALSFIDNTSINSNSANLNIVVDQFHSFAEQNKSYYLQTYLFSDFQKTSMVAESIVDDSIASWNFIKMYNQETANIFIDSVYILNPVLLPDRIENLYVIIKNASENSVENLGLKLIINEEIKSIANADIGPGEIKTIEMQFNTGNKSWKKAQIEIEDYPVTFDDKLLFAFEVYDKINVLAINKEKAEVVFSAFYASDSIFNLEQTSYRSIDYQGLSANNLIILNGLDNISSGLISNLVDYVSNGGNLMLIPPADGEISDFNQLLSSINMGQIYGPAISETRIKGVKLENSIFGDAIEDLPENADLPILFKQYQYGGSFNTNTISLLDLLNGDPLLLKKDLGSGEVFLLNISLDQEFSNLSRHKLFVPLMYGAAIAGKSNMKLFNTIGKPSTIEIKLNPKNELNPDAAFELSSLNENLSFVPSQRRYANKLQLNFDKLPYESGFYELKTSKNEGLVNESPVLAFNYNRQESLMDYYSNNDLVEILKNSSIKNYSVKEFQNSSTEEVINTAENEANQWLVFIIFALLFLLSESLILRFWP
ncbi:MAG: hypothetical protein C0598_14495 [Marinilabiliales bacterium]|nr:MAG: hypothetical protein C0598_14495 [Marinilabiliales bacterium]